MMTLDRLLLMLGFFAGSLAQVNPENRYFEVLQATSQLRIAGVPGGGQGINYRLRLKIKTDRAITFDAIWLAGKKLNIQLENGNSPGQIKSARNAVVTLLAADFRAGPAKNGRNQEEPGYASAAETAKAPIEYEGAALLRYVVDGSTKYFPVSRITVLPPVYGQ
jgi:hypothetical protein